MTNITAHPTYTETRKTVAQAREAMIKRQAAEIERLRAALKEVGAHEPKDCQASAGWDALRWVQAKAYAALHHQQTGEPTK